jgi:cell division septum initiation protein DivIVA
MRYSNAAITQGFQSLAAERAEVERKKAEVDQMKDFGNLFQNPTPVTPQQDQGFTPFEFDNAAPANAGGDPTVMALQQEVNQLKQQLNGFTSQNTAHMEAVRNVQESVAFMRDMGVNVPADLTPLSHAIAAESGGEGTPEYYAKAKDPMYVNRKIREVYGNVPAPASQTPVEPQKPAVRNLRLRRPPVSPNRTKTVQRETQNTTTRKTLEKELAHAYKMTEKITSGPDFYKWGAKVQELQVKLDDLNSKGSPDG